MTAAQRRGRCFSPLLSLTLCSAVDSDANRREFRGKYPPARPLSDTAGAQARWPCSGDSIPRPHHRAEALRGLPTPRVTLDKLLTRRLPDVELLTTGGAGVPMLVASCATKRGLKWLLQQWIL